MAITIDHDMIHDYTDFSLAAWLRTKSESESLGCCQMRIQKIGAVSVHPLEVSGIKAMSDRDRTTKAHVFAKEKLAKVLCPLCAARKQYSDPIGRVDAHVYVFACKRRNTRTFYILNMMSNIICEALYVIRLLRFLYRLVFASLRSDVFQNQNVHADDN